MSSGGFNLVVFIFEVGEEIFIGGFLIETNEEVPCDYQISENFMDRGDKFFNIFCGMSFFRNPQKGFPFLVIVLIYFF